MAHADVLSHTDYVKETHTGELNPEIITRFTTDDYRAVFPNRTRVAEGDTLDLSASPFGYAESGGSSWPRSQVAETLPSSQAVETLPENLTTEILPIEPKLTPEQQLQAILANVPTQSSPEFLDAMFKTTALLSDQLDIAEAAYDAYEAFPSRLLRETKEEYSTAYNSLSPTWRKDSEFINTLSNLPNLILSGRTAEATEVLKKLQTIAGDQSKEQLQAFFDSLIRVTNDNPSLVTDYNNLQNAYIQALTTFDDMNAALKASPFGRE